MINNILLTGSKGFIGSYFLKNYAKEYKIRTFSFRDNSNEKLCVDTIDAIVHLSALVHQMGGASADEYKKVNVTQTLNLAKKAKTDGVKHFIFMSSVKVYGEETDSIYTEKSKCFPQDDYGKSKLKAEQELQKLECETFKVSILRTPIVYGYGVKANIQNLISLIKKVPILPFDKIYNKRSMIYIGNLCHMIDAIIQQEKAGVFLATDDSAVSTTDLIQLIAKTLKKNTFLIKIPLFEDLLRTVKPMLYKRLYKSLEIDNSETRKVLDLENPYSMEEGIALMLGTKV